MPSRVRPVPVWAEPVLLRPICLVGSLPNASLDEMRKVLFSDAGKWDCSRVNTRLQSHVLCCLGLYTLAVFSRGVQSAKSESPEFASGMPPKERNSNVCEPYCDNILSSRISP
jgi:hypothetical protein